jgi:hypothetical protein
MQFPLCTLSRHGPDTRLVDQLTPSPILFDRGMLGGNQNAQGLRLARIIAAVPVASDLFIIESIIGVPPTYFDLLAAARGSERQVLLRAVNPFNKFITPVALEDDHIEERVAGVRIMGE